MSNRLLLVVVATLVLLIVGLMTGPAFSGEHPWDSDRGEGNGGPKSGVVVDTTLVAPDTIGVGVNPVTTPTTAPVWTVIVKITWTAMMAM